MAREKREVWEKRIVRWRESGLTSKEFAAELGVNAATLMQWKYRLAAEARGVKQQTVAPPTEAVAFVEVKPTTAETERPRSIAQAAFEVVLASGAVVRVPAHFDASTLRRLLDVMAGR
jgi:hypothetical protein